MASAVETSATVAIFCVCLEGSWPAGTQPGAGTRMMSDPKSMNTK